MALTARQHWHPFKVFPIPQIRARVFGLANGLRHRFGISVYIILSRFINVDPLSRGK